MEERPVTAPYGSWRSPITTDVVLGSVVSLSEVAIDDEAIYWLEARPHEGGRSVLVRRGPDGAVADLTPAPFNVRNRVHEYGGGAYAVAGGIVYFSNFGDDRLYSLAGTGAPEAITPPAPLRYADLIVDRHRDHLICVREDHTESDQDAINTLVAFDLRDGTEQTVLASGNDFYASPRLSRDGANLAWLTWNHPNMPWDGTELWVARVEPDGSLSDQRCVAGELEESIFQPQWSPDGTLYFSSDRSGWWNLFRLHGEAVEQVTDLEAEIGLPQWVFEMSVYAFVGPERIVCSIHRAGLSHLAEIDAQSGTVRPIETGYVEVDDITAQGSRVLFIGESAFRPHEIVELNAESGSMQVVRAAGTVPISPDSISEAHPIEFPTENGLTAFALYYPPRNPGFTPPTGELPPLIVSSHGGPTSAAHPGLALLDVQFWTSRGFAVVDVNYGGSTGYGREYRERLNGQWGVVDVDDCVNAARYLAEKGFVDSRRLIIHGGSAGGYTTLAALAFRAVFTAGASHYGIGDLEALLADTHKFESQYDTHLIGERPAADALFRERSPIHYVDQISCPVILFQGEEDKVVPPTQARLIIDALERKKLPYAALFFAGEGHGFRRAENIKRSIEAELYFYSRIFGFELAEPVEPVEIHNLPVGAG